MNTKYTIPEWMLPEIPTVTPHATITYEEGKYLLLSPDGSVNGSYNNILSAYEQAEESYPENFNFDDSIPEKEPFGASAPTDHPDFFTFLFGVTEADRALALESLYGEWLKAAEAYHDNPDDLVTSYNFVNFHPVFWARDTPEKTWDWCTSHAQSIWMDLMLDGDTNDVVWALETGSHIAPHYTHFCHDIRLDTFAPTVEQGFIELARKVSEHFNDDGSEKE